MAADPVANHSEEFAPDADHADANHVKKSKADKKKKKNFAKSKTSNSAGGLDPCCAVTDDFLQGCCFLPT